MQRSEAASSQPKSSSLRPLGSNSEGMVESNLGAACHRRGKVMSKQVGYTAGLSCEPSSVHSSQPNIISSECVQTGLLTTRSTTLHQLLSLASHNT